MLDRHRSTYFTSDVATGKIGGNLLSNNFISAKVAFIKSRASQAFEIDRAATRMEEQMNAIISSRL